MKRFFSLFHSFLHVESSSRSICGTSCHILLPSVLVSFGDSWLHGEIGSTETIAMYYVNEPLSVLEVSNGTFKGHKAKRVSVTVYKIDVLRRECSRCKYKGLSFSTGEILPRDIIRFLFLFHIVAGRQFVSSCGTILRFKVYRAR